MLQKVLVEKLEAELLPPMITQLLEERLATLLEKCEAYLPLVAWPTVLTVTQNLSSHEAMCCLKTWSNSWTTSARFHDSNLERCALGCKSALDDLSHYVRCERLWVEVDIATSVEVEEEPDTIQQRLLLETPTSERARRLVVAFSGYHVLKNGHLGRIQRTEASNDYRDVISLTRSLADAYAIKHPRKGPRGERRCESRRIECPEIVPSGTDARSCTLPEADFPTRYAVEDDRTTACGTWVPRPSAPEGASREGCEPECNDLALGEHHAGCSVALLALEAGEATMVTRTAHTIRILSPPWS